MTSNARNLKFSIMGMLEHIDENTLGPNGAKDKGEHLHDKDLLLGFTDGWDAATKEENKMRFQIYVCTILISIVAFLISFLLIFCAVAFLT